MCLLCDDEKAYLAYMNYLDAMERQGKTADPNKAVEAVLDQLEAADKARAKQDGPAQDDPATTRPCLHSSAARSINTDLTSLTLAEARDGLAKKSFTSLELTDAHLARWSRARAQCLRAGDAGSGARHGARQRRRIANGEGGPLAGIPLGIKDLFRDQGRAHHGLLENLGQFRTDLRVHHHRAALARRRGDARQAQQ